MKLTTKVLLITAAILVIIGLIGFAVCISLLDFGKQFETNNKTETVDVTERFSGITVDADTEDVSFVKSDDGRCKVIFSLNKYTEHIAVVQNGVLKINTKDTRKWYEKTGLFLGANQKIKIYLPEENYSSLTVKKSTGDITVKNIDYEGNINIKVSTGDVRMTDVTCKSLISSGSTGDMVLKNVIATESFDLKRSTGDIRFDGCDSEKITVKTSTGDVTGTLLSDKEFFTETSTGDVTVPKSLSGGKCEINTSTGDIIIDIRE